MIEGLILEEKSWAILISQIDIPILEYQIVTHTNKKKQRQTKTKGERV